MNTLKIATLVFLASGLTISSHVLAAPKINGQVSITIGSHPDYRRPPPPVVHRPPPPRPAYRHPPARRVFAPPRPYYTPPPRVVYVDRPVVVQSPPIYMEKPVAPPPPSRPIRPISQNENDYWFYCAPSSAYYPDVKECATDWMKVLP